VSAKKSLGKNRATKTRENESGSMQYVNYRYNYRSKFRVQLQ